MGDGFTIPADEVAAALGMGVMRAAAEKAKEPTARHALLKPPKCARCGHVVDQFAATEDHSAAEVVLVAGCHGETESVRLAFEEVLITPAFRMGLAFAGERTAKLLPDGVAADSEEGDGG